MCIPISILKPAVVQLWMTRDETAPFAKASVNPSWSTLLEDRAELSHPRGLNPMIML